MFEDRFTATERANFRTARTLTNLTCDILKGGFIILLSLFMCCIMSVATVVTFAIALFIGFSITIYVLLAVEAFVLAVAILLIKNTQRKLINS